MIRVTAFILAVCGFAAAVFGQDWRPARVWITGGEKSVWVIGASPKESGSLPTIQMWYAGPEEPTGQPRQSGTLPAVSGDIQEAAADAKALHILFSDLTTRDYFPKRDSAAGARWRDQSDKPPLAWGGDATEGTLWALVRTESLKAPTTLAATQAADRDTETPAAEPAPRLTLLQLRNDSWQRLPAPPAAEEGLQFWLTGRAGRPWLFWLESDHRLLTASLAEETAAPPSTADAGDGWTAPALVLAEPDLRCGWAGAGKDGPVFIAGRGPGAAQVQLHVYMWDGAAWVSKGAARDGTELLEIDPQKCGVGVAGNRLTVARAADKEQLEFGAGDLGISPSMRFTRLAFFTSPVDETLSWESLLMMAVMLALLTMVMWSRREQIVRPVLLPPGLILAPVWRRLLATTIDAIPALLMVWPFSFMFLPAVPESANLATIVEMSLSPEMQAKMLPIYCAFVLLYGIWCLAWELSIASTPGKLLFGCRVMGTQSPRPLARQIIWRNALRVVEVGFGQTGWIVTLMMLVLVTRKRQRLGDVLGDTIVVMPGEEEKTEQADRNDQP